MKRIFLAVALTMGLSFVGCDDRVSSPTAPNQKVVVSKNFSKTITVVSKKDSDIVIGKIVDRQSELGSPVVVCSEEMNICSRTNSKGNYVLTPQPISFPGTAILAARTFSDDTLTTPENFVPIIQNDTTFDTTSTLDTNVVSTNGVDSIIVTDSIIITQNIVVVESIPVDDTLSVVSNGTILREVPITSWGFILPTNYIVQRDISAKDSTFDGAIETVEAVYFITGDSVAKVITLGRSGKFFSGFLYTFYDDSSYIKDTKIYNMFLRARDSNDNIICATPIRTFSEKFGDFETEVFSKKVGIPESKIAPRIIPAAENNKTLTESINDYLSFRDTTINWVDVNNVSLQYYIVSLDDGLEYYQFMRTIEVSKVYDSISVEVYSENDSVEFMYMNNKKYVTAVVPNTWNRVKVGIEGNTLLYIYSKSNQASFRNIRLYLK